MKLSMFSVAVLVSQAGSSVIVLAPTTWSGATGYLKSIGAPGW